MKLHIGIAGPISTESIADFLDGDVSELPNGYAGAPLLGTLVGALLERGHEVSAYTTDSALPLDLPRPVMAQGERFRIYYCPVRKHSIRNNGRHLGRIVDFFRLERRYLEQAIRLDAPDVVHAHWTYEFAWAALDTGLPTVITCHDSPLQILKYMPNLYRLGRYFMARRVLRRAQVLTAVSPYMRDEVQAWAGVPITVVPNPLSDYVFTLGREARQPPADGAWRIAMVLNGWGKCKNPEAALRAFAKLRTHFPTTRLYCYGADFGPDETAEKWAQAQGIAQGVQFVGWMPHQRLLSHLSESHLLLHPALEESFGVAVAEAMALGLPVVGGQGSGAVPWVVDQAGLLVDVSKPQEIANAAGRLITDDALYVKCSAAAIQRVKAFDPDLIAGQYEAAYALAMGSGMAAGPARHGLSHRDIPVIR